MQHAGETMRMTVIRDLRDRHAALARIHHLAHHDALTGLPNRMAFMEQLDHAMGAARAVEGALALLFIDLDHFKRVNDSLGHLAGDALLQTVARRITDLLRSADVVARFGGDEFMVLLSGNPSRDTVADVARKLLGAIEAPLVAEGRPISVTPSIGIAMFPGDGATPAELIKHADTAMYLAKARGRATLQFFDAALARDAYAALVMEGQLAQALERGEFVLHFQPQVRADDGALVGAEALVRWQHPERGLLLPDEFIPVAEQQRLMLPLGRWVLREAARVAKGWRDAGIGELPVAVNLSTLQFQAPDFVSGVGDVLRETGLPGHLLELELTERMLMEDWQLVRHKLHQLKALGIRLSVDDFGTGHSSLGHLKELPIDKMKIDRSFVTDLPGRRDSAAIVRAIIQMGRSLGITVIAEGVETEAQREFLAFESCDELQGDAVSPPLSGVAFATWVGRAAGG
jgi:diguanylate cyclase (GGDEF)-like protein